MLKKISRFVIFLLLAALIFAPFWPWKLWVHDAIQTRLAEKNVHSEFTVEDASPGILILKDIVIKDFPTTFDTFDMRYSARELLSKRLVIETVVLRSKDGEFSTKNINRELFRPSASSFTVDVKHMPLGAIMKLLTGGKADATGIVSGAIPVTWEKDGRITVTGGRLEAEGSGTLSVSPETIPGNNDQIEQVRAALQDFHYETFSLETATGEDKKLSILLQLRGNNPNAYNGREIKLNVRLKGDLLDLWKQSVTTITDPKRLLE